VSFALKFSISEASVSSMISFDCFLLSSIRKGSFITMSEKLQPLLTLQSKPMPNRPSAAKAHQANKIAPNAAMIRIVYAIALCVDASCRGGIFRQRTLLINWSLLQYSLVSIISLDRSSWSCSRLDRSNFLDLRRRLVRPLQAQRQHLKFGNQLKRRRKIARDVGPSAPRFRCDMIEKLRMNL
jgi:hypothetical protein